MAPRRGIRQTSELATILSAEELDIDAKLRSYDRKITSMREAAAGVATPHNSRRRHALNRSVAEDYVKAKRTQQRLQKVGGAQVASLLLLAGFILRGTMLFLLVFVLGVACGLAASFGKVQRLHAVCTALNVAFFCASSGTASACVLLLIASTDPSRHYSAGAVLFVLLVGAIHTVRAPITPDFTASPHSLAVCDTQLGSVQAGAYFAGFVLTFPLMLYRYETVASDEAAADAQSIHANCRASACDVFAESSMPMVRAPRDMLTVVQLARCCGSLPHFPLSPKVLKPTPA